MASASKSDDAENGSEKGQSLVQLVVEGVIDGVGKGQFAPGQRLIAADLAETFHVSRAPVREALHILAGEGVVDLIPNRGARIKKLTNTQLVDFLEFS
ncbi:MAG: GntR family transcriptional regulator, partial [Alphaproteobacteria bacterium]